MTEDLKVSADSLRPAIFEGWGKKQGGAVKTWKKRWFILKETKLWYFAGKTDEEAKGFIELPPGTEIRDVSQNKKFMFSINSRNTKGSRVFYIITDSSVEHTSFFEALKKVLTKNNDKASAPIASVQTTQPTQPAAASTPRAAPTGPVDINNSGRINIEKVKSKISWLQVEGENVVEFWKYWMDSTPQLDALEPGQSINFNLVVSGNTEKLSWRVSGPQGALIQNMVDFFWNVGAPDEEIDHLNNLGCQINPSIIGSWIDMSVMNGMDGGWFFKGDLQNDIIRDCADKCDHAEKLISWAKEKNLNIICQMGRDMGATPPRQSEFRFKVEGNAQNRLNVVQSAFSTFGFPAIPQNIADIIGQLGPNVTYLYLCVVVSTEGFVKISVLIPEPMQNVIDGFLSGMSDVKDNNIALHRDITNTIGTKPLFVEYCYLNQGYGYEVYKEGGDVLVHYNLGNETR